MRTEPYTSTQWNVVEWYDSDVKQRMFAKKRIRNLPFDRLTGEIQGYVDSDEFESAKLLVRWSDYETDSIVQQIDYDDNEIDFK